MERKKQIILFVGGIILGGVAVALWPSFVGHKNTTSTEAGVVQAPATNTETPLVMPTLSTVAYEGSGTTTRITIDVSYPKVIMNGNAQVAEKANAAIGAWVDGIVNDFKQEENGTDMDGIPENFQSSLTMDWDPMLISPQMLSIKFNYSAYSAGAAHPNSMSRVFNYDLVKGKKLETTDLFSAKEEALPLLSTLSRIALKKELNDVSKEEWDTQVIPGTEPTEENFREVALTKDGLLVIFNPYQVAPYARGTQDVLIGTNDISGKLTVEAQNAIRNAR